MFHNLVSRSHVSFTAVDLETMRIPGVLQRLSLSYLLVALMETVFARREDKFQVYYSYIYCVINKKKCFGN